MNPLGLFLAFLILGLAIGLGLFFCANSTATFLREARRSTRVGLATHGGLHGTLVMFTHTVFLLLGMALIAAGAYATYAVIYG